MKPLLALSTSWCSYRHTDGYAMAREMADLGFEYVELSHGIRITLVPGLLRAVEERVVKVSSTHNFCPLPTGFSQAAPNLYEPSRWDYQEHDQWLRHTKRSLDFAEQVGAKVLVTHLGSVHFFWTNPARRLRQFLRRHEGDVRPDAGYQRLLRRVMAKVRARMPRYWEQVRVSLDAIREHALARGVAIGCENREKLEELPLDDDFEPLFQGLAQPHLCGYWHDTGHAELKQGMGLLDHRQHLERNAGRLLGFHLHDVSADRDDHVPIGEGKIDFEMVSQFWRPEHLLTLELSPRVEREQVRESKAAIEGLIQRRFR